MLKYVQLGESIDFGRNIQKKVQIYRDGKDKTINIDQLENIFDSMKNAALQKKQKMSIVRVYVMNGEKRSSYKDIDDFYDYYMGRVANADKFHEFNQIEITYIVQKPKAKTK